MREVWRLVSVAARADGSVVVTGETGTGKEVVARALHRLSPRRAGPFVAVNCAALPPTLLESELFGHEKGAFSGATARRRGRFELADGGTLFLDEVGDLPLGLQVKLLRVLQERRFERVGGSQTLAVDVRVVAATHRVLEDEVRDGRFRADLYYRINVLSVRVPALRERKADILPLFDHFVGCAAAREGRATPRADREARARLLRHDWPGNVRELQNAAERALMTATADIVGAEDLPTLSGVPAREPGVGAAMVGLTLAEVEREAIVATYAAVGTIRGTAEMLGVSERKIHYRLKEYRRAGVLPRGRGRPTVRAESPPASVAADRPRVLLAEDDDDLRGALVEFLEAAGYRVSAVRDGSALLEHLGRELPFEQRGAPADVIITDVRMPRVSGLQLLESVADSGYSTPIVVMSAFGDDELRDRAASLGAVAFLDKPIDTGKLRRVLGGVVAR
jgi:DNA-binding NtrC family response regulator